MQSPRNPNPIDCGCKHNMVASNILPTIFELFSDACDCQQHFTYYFCRIVFMMFSDGQQYFAYIIFALFSDVQFLPISGLLGANMKTRLDKSICTWWNGPCLFEVMDCIEVPLRDPKGPVR